MCDVKEKANESSKYLGAFVNYNQFHASEIVATYQKNHQRIGNANEKKKSVQ